MKFDRSGIPQDVLQETVLRTLSGQLQSHIGPPHRCLLVLHLLRFPKGLRRHPFCASEVVSNCSLRYSGHHNHHRRHHRRIFLHTHHLDQHLPHRPSPTLPPHHTWSHSWSDLLHHNCRKPDVEPNGTPDPRDCSVLHICRRNPRLRRCAIWSDVRSSRRQQVKEISRQANVHGELPLHDNETAIALGVSLVPCLRLQAHRILLVLDALLPRIYRCNVRHEGSLV